MGRWVFAEACRQLAEWRAQYPKLRLVVRVNMSPAQFATDEIVDFVENCMRVHDVPGDRLCIEMTEHAVMAEPEKTARILAGSSRSASTSRSTTSAPGYSSMTELKRLPVNLLEAGHELRPGHHSDKRDRAIVEAIIRLGKALDLEVVAEGIEDGVDDRQAARARLPRGQGYLLSMPIAPEELTAMMEAGGDQPPAPFARLLGRVLQGEGRPV